MTTELRRLNAAPGIGLSESVLYIATLSVLLAGAGLAFRMIVTGFKVAQESGQMLTSARAALYQITEDTRSSDSAMPSDPVPAIANLECAQLRALIVPGNPIPGLPSAGGTGVE